MNSSIIVWNTSNGERWSVPLETTEVRIGRTASGVADAQDLVIPSAILSRQHCVLRAAQAGWTIEHLGLNDTCVDGVAVPHAAPQALTASAEIELGEYVLKFVAADAAKVEAVVSSEATLFDIERRLHMALLDRIGSLFGQSQAQEVTSEGGRTRIMQTLDEQVERWFGETAEALRAELCGFFILQRLRRHLAGIVTAAGVGSGAPQGAVRRLERAVLADLEAAVQQDAPAAGHAMLLERLDEQFAVAYRRHSRDLSAGAMEEVVKGGVRKDLEDLVFGLGPLEDFLRAANVSEIMVVSPQQIFIERHGVIEDARCRFVSEQALSNVINRILQPVYRSVNTASPMVDARLPDGSRVNAIIPPLALKGPCLTIRKFARVPLEIGDLVAQGTISEAMVRFLRGCVMGHRNLVVAGGTGSGKTTMLNCLSRFIARRERIVTVEDTAELQLQQSHVVTLEARPMNVEGKGEVSIRDLVRNALRMRPDRIVVGECRGAETLDMLQAMNTGHDGSMTTAHANTPRDLVLRLETMVLMGVAMPVQAIRDQIVAAVDIVVQLRRFADGVRRVTAVSEVVGIDDLDGTVIVEDIFVFRGADGVGGGFAHTGYIPQFMDDLLTRGDVDLDVFF